jgi:outer membrane protein assembly factor BamB
MISIIAQTSRHDSFALFNAFRWYTIYTIHISRRSRIRRRLGAKIGRKRDVEFRIAQIVLIIGLYSLFTPGCKAGASGVNPTGAATPGTDSSTLAALLPAPGALRSFSATKLDLNGSEYAAVWPLNKVTASGSSAWYLPEYTGANRRLADAAYALYAFAVGDAQGNATLHLYFGQLGAPSDGWIGLADYARGRWDWYPLPRPDKQHCALGLSLAGRSTGGTLPVALVFTGTQPWLLSRLQLDIPDPDVAPWPMDGQNAQRTRRSPYVGSQTGKLKWAFHTTGAFNGISGAVAGPDGVVYIASGPELHAYNADGSVRWHSAIIRPWTRPAIAPDGTLYVGTAQNTLEAIRPDGSSKWSYPLPKVALNPAVGADGTVYVGCEDNKLYAIAPDMMLKWSFKVGGKAITPVVGVDGRIYTSNRTILQWDEKVFVINPDGTLAWSFDEQGVKSVPALAADGSVCFSCGADVIVLDSAGALRWRYSTPNEHSMNLAACAADGTVYVGNDDHNLYALTKDGSLQWAFETGGEVKTTPVIDSDGAVYIGSDDGYLYSINPDGTKRWSYDTGNKFCSQLTKGPDETCILISDFTIYSYPYSSMCVVGFDGTAKWIYLGGGYIRSSPVVSGDGTIYFGSDDGYIYAVNSDGTLKWNYYLKYSILAGPAIGPDGTVYVQEGQLYAFNPDGTSKWICSIIGHESSPAIGFNSSILFDGTDGFHYAIDTEGSLIWRVTNGQGYRSPAICSDGTSFWGSGDILSAVSKDGELIWSTAASSFRGPAIGSGNTVYVGGEMGELSAFSASGELLWNNAFGSSTCISSLAIATDDTIYSGNYDNSLYALNSNGSLRWSYPTEGPVYSSPAIGADGTLYFGSYDASFYALSPDGVLKWNFKTGSAIERNPAIGADGTVYVGSNDGKLYAFGD